MDKETLQGLLGRVEIPYLLASLVMEAWCGRHKEDGDRRRVEAETALIEAHRRAEAAAEERHRQEETERTNKELEEAEALAWKKDAATKAEIERRCFEVAALEKAASISSKRCTLHWGVGSKWKRTSTMPKCPVSAPASKGWGSAAPMLSKFKRGKRSSN
ncbi:unnamed protein product [Ectocarpus sp. 4 AP-2014]